MNLVIDTNILISGLIRDGLTRHLIVNSPFMFFIPEQEIIELKKYEREISKKSGKSIGDIRDLIRKLLKYVTIIRNKFLVRYKDEANKIIGKIDKDDVLFVAAALFLDCPIWSEDKHFKKQNKIETFTTKDVLTFIKDGNKF